MTISLIAAVSENGVIGRGNALPWHLSSDLKRFKRLTTGHPVIMGRKTFESIGRPLPNRRTIVVTRDVSFNGGEFTVANSFEEALELTRGEEEVFVIGGEEVFRRALPLADRLYLTVVHAEVSGDATFPPLEAAEWTLVQAERHTAGQQDDYDHTFQVWERGPRHTN